MSLKISIVTIGSSKSREIYSTIESVIKYSQEYENWIFVVFNKEEERQLQLYLLKKYPYLSNYFIFSDNKGISSAMNIAISQLIESEAYIWFLHAGDLAIKNVSYNIKSNIKYTLHFFPVIVSLPTNTNGTLKSTNVNWKTKIRTGPCILHQGVLAHPILFKKYGTFCEDLSSIMDYEWFYRISNKSEVNCLFHSEPIASFALGGKSSDVIQAAKEHFFVYRKFGMSIYKSLIKSIMILFLKILYIIKNYYIPNLIGRKLWF